MGKKRILLLAHSRIHVLPRIFVCTKLRICQARQHSFFHDLPDGHLLLREQTSHSVFRNATGREDIAIGLSCVHQVLKGAGNQSPFQLCFCCLKLWSLCNSHIFCIYTQNIITVKFIRNILHTLQIVRDAPPC